LISWAKSCALFVEVSPDHLTDLDAPFRLLRDIAVGKLAGHDNVTVAERHGVVDGADVSDDKVLVGLDPASKVMEATAFGHAFAPDS